MVFMPRLIAIVGSKVTKNIRTVQEQIAPHMKIFTIWPLFVYMTSQIVYLTSQIYDLTSRLCLVSNFAFSDGMGKNERRDSMRLIFFIILRLVAH